jgi:hypothetical protein
MCVRLIRIGKSGSSPPSYTTPFEGSKQLVEIACEKHGTIEFSVSQDQTIKLK